MACVEYMRGILAAHKPDEIVVETVARTRGKSDSGYVMARWGQPKVLLNVHIDTVPSGEGWTSDPLKLRREGERVIGLGTSDIKGAAACILAAMETHPPKDVAVLFSGDEEHGSEVMPAVIERGHYGGAKMAIVCEPTCCEVGRRHRGMLALNALFTGRGGHSSLSDVTERPLLQAARLAAAWGEYNDVHLAFGKEPYKGLCLNIGDIENDGAYNVIPTRSKLWASMRPPPGDNVAARREDLLRIAGEVAPEAVMDTIVAFEPFDSQNPEAFSPVFENTPIVDLPYWTEAAMLSKAGLNVVVYGPGDVEQAHKPNEYVTEAHLLTAAAAYGRALSGAYL
ncbi:M20/M25/M40 family metallo-hydrolase [Hellea sp.]|nr:M20/M25/M40 family metallo-hydrolase [Hellea sp.]